MPSIFSLKTVQLKTCHLKYIIPNDAYIKVEVIQLYSSSDSVIMIGNLELRFLKIEAHGSKYN